jgi:hypothetical protein
MFNANANRHVARAKLQPFELQESNEHQASIKPASSQLRASIKPASH